MRELAAAASASIPSSQLAAMKLIVNQAYENMGLASTQALGPILDGLMRNTPDAQPLHRARRREGVRAVVAERDGPFGDYSQAPPDQQPGPDPRDRAMTRATDEQARLPFYGPRDPAPDYEGHLGDPGRYPFTRGRRASAHGGGWIHRELSGEGDPRRSNEQLRTLLGAGALGVDVIGDNPTQSALDPDHPMSAPAVGTTGVSICRALDFVELLEGIPLDQVTLSHSLPAAFAIAGQHLAATTLGFDPSVLRGSSIQGPLYTEDCSYAMFLPFEVRMRLTLDSIAFSLRTMPRFHPYLEDTYFISDGGLDTVEEMALGFVQLRRSPVASSGVASRWTPSRRASRCSSTAGWTSSRRSPRSARRGGCSPA